MGMARQKLILMSFQTRIAWISYETGVFFAPRAVSDCSSERKGGNNEFRGEFARSAPFNTGLLVVLGFFFASSSIARVALMLRPI